MSHKPRKSGFQQIDVSLLRDGRFTPPQFRVLLALMSYLPAVFPSLRALERDTGLCELTVRRAVDALRDANVVSWEGRGLGRVYSIHDAELWQLGDKPKLKPKRKSAFKRVLANPERIEALARAAVEGSDEP